MKNMNKGSIKLQFTLSTLLIILILVDNIDFHVYNMESLYWFLSASAQTIASFIALVFAGFTFMNANTNNFDFNDERYELYYTTKIQLYKDFKILATISCAAICSSLGLVLLNRYNDVYLIEYLQFIDIILIIISLVKGFIFILEVANPQKYHKLAQPLAKKISKELEVSLTRKRTIRDVDQMTLEDIDNISLEELDSKKMDEYRFEFIRVFINLESHIREFLRETTGEDFDGKGFHSLILKLENKLNNKSLFEELRALNRLRNVIVHGELDSIDKSTYINANKVYNYTIEYLNSIKT